MARDQTPFRRDLAAFLSDPSAVIGTALVGLVLVVALVAPLISPQNPFDLTQLDARDGRLPPGATAPSGGTFWLGTDAHGRDMLAAIFYGLRTSLAVGALSTLIALAIGAALGLGAAYLGGRIETVIRRVAEVQLSFPAILIAVFLLWVLGQGMGQVIAALAAVQWAYYARAARGAARSEMGKEYIEAARCLALAPWRIVFRHVLPNCMPPLLFVAAVQVAAAIALEATLSFLGLGVPITEPSLGRLIADGYHDLLSGTYWISIFPGMALLLLIVSLNLVADQLEYVLDARRHR